MWFVPGNPTWEIKPATVHRKTENLTKTMSRMQAEFPTVSVVVPTFNSQKTLKNCIEACLAQDYPLELLEVIVVDDGSTDRTGELLKKYNVTHLRQNNTGPAGARNCGWMAGDGEIICFTDSDCVPQKDWVSTLVKEFTSPEIAAVGGTYGIENPSSLLARLIHFEIIWRHARLPRLVDYLGGFNVAYRRRVLVEIQGFDQSFPSASAEDNDLSYRVKKAGHLLLFTKQAVVGHFHPDKLWGYLKSQFRHGYWRMKLYSRHADMIKGDQYAGPSDLIQPPLAMAGLALLPLAFWPALAWVPVLILILGLLLAMGHGYALSGGGRMFLLFGLLGWLRSFARGLGLVFGTVRFKPLFQRKTRCADLSAMADKRKG